MKIFKAALKYCFIFLLFYDFISAVSEADIPANASAYGSGWVCNHGYKRQGSGCAEINVPVNASAYGSGWVCNLGFKRQGQKCVEMSKKEKQDQIKQIQIYQASQRSKILNYDGEEFTLRDVEGKCEVYRYSENYGDLECSGSDLRPIERYCTVSMYSDNYGGIDC